MTRTAEGRSRIEAGAAPRRLLRLADLIRDRAATGTASLFSHGAHPLARTLDHPGDPGLFGPGSMTWPVAGDTAVFVGGIRALLVQAAHPEVAAGVAQHSRYREDPLGRLTRTAAYVTATSFGAMPEVSRAVAIVRGRQLPHPAWDAAARPRLTWSFRERLAVVATTSPAPAWGAGPAEYEQLKGMPAVRAGRPGTSVLV